MYFKETGRNGKDCIHLSQDREQVVDSPEHGNVILTLYLPTLYPGSFIWTRRFSPDPAGLGLRVIQSSSRPLQQRTRVRILRRAPVQ